MSIIQGRNGFHFMCIPTSLVASTCTPTMNDIPDYALKVPIEKVAGNT